MNDVNEIDEAGLDADDNHHDEAHDEAVSVFAPKPRRKYGKFALGFTALSALVIGGASGGGFVQYIMPHFTASQTQNTVSQQADISALDTKLDAIADENAALKTRLSKLAQDLESVKKTANSTKKISSKPVDLSDIEGRLLKLETAPKPAVSKALPIDPKLVKRLEALQKQGSPALDLSSFETRITQLEEAQPLILDLEEFVAQQKQRQRDVEQKYEGLSGNLKALHERLDKTIIQTDAAQSPAMSLAQPFPKQALLDALETQAQDKPLLKRALGKHIKVKNPSDPATIIDAIEADISQGNMTSAAARYDQLPPKLRVIGSKWRDSVK